MIGGCVESDVSVSLPERCSILDIPLDAVIDGSFLFPLATRGDNINTYYSCKRR